MKLLLTSLIIFMLANNIAAQADTAYKFTYTFHGESTGHYVHFSTDTSINKSGSTSVSGCLMNGSQQIKEKVYACLTYGHEEIIFCTRFLNGKFDTTINSRGVGLLMGPYHLTVTSADGSYSDINFEIQQGQHLNFNLFDPFLSLSNIYDIHSKRKLTKDKIEKIKKCVKGKNNIGGCAEKNVYYVDMEI